MKALLLALLMVALAAGGSLAASAPKQNPSLPVEAELEQQRPYECRGGEFFILKASYALPNGGSIVVFKEPNKDARIQVYWDKNGEFQVAYVNGEKFTSMDALVQAFGEPCDAFSRRT